MVNYNQLMLSGRVEKNVNHLNLKRENVPAFLLILLISVQVAVFLWFGTAKSEYHIDEIYSYLLSNSQSEAQISVHDEWLNQQDWQAYVTVQEGHRFDYTTVYQNQITDCHPPLFYMILHTVCSFFPGVFSKWIGIGLNIVLYCAASVLLYFLACRLIGNKYLSLLCVLLWGSSQIGIDTVIFIRMYMLLTLLTIALTLVHVKMIQNGQTKGTLLLCFVLTFSGAFTQYFFIVYAFFLAVFYICYRLKQKEIKKAAVYGAAMLLGVVMMYVVFPYCVMHAFGSPTNNIGREVSKNLFDFSGWLNGFMNLAAAIVFGIVGELWENKLLGIGVFLTAVVILIIAFVMRKDREKPKALLERHKQEGIFFLFSIFFLLVTIFVVAHLPGKYVSGRYIYNLVPVICLCAVWGGSLIFKIFGLNKRLLAAILLVIGVMNGIFVVANKQCSYLFEKKHEINAEIAETYANGDCMLIYNGATYVPTSAFTLLSNFQGVYMNTLEYVTENFDRILEGRTDNGGLVVLVHTDQIWSAGYSDGDAVMERMLKSSEQFTQYENLGTIDFCSVYYLN